MNVLKIRLTMVDIATTSKQFFSLQGQQPKMTIKIVVAVPFKCNSFLIYAELKT